MTNAAWVNGRRVEPLRSDSRGGWVDVTNQPGSDESWSDEELTALALAADTDAPLSPDATVWEGAAFSRTGLLPSWYMPTPVARRHSRWSRSVVVIVIVGFLVIDAFGLCITSGFLSLA